MITLQYGKLPLNWRHFLNDRNITMYPGQVLLAVSVMKGYTHNQVEHFEELLKEYNTPQEYIRHHSNGIIAIVPQDTAVMIKLRML